MSNLRGEHEQKYITVEMVQRKAYQTILAGKPESVSMFIQENENKIDIKGTVCERLAQSGD
jgi:hypothetical protein